GGIYLEYIRNNEARGGNWMGTINFSNSSSNPLNTGFAYANALLGVFNSYTQLDGYRSTRNRAYEAEWYVQDTWRPSRRWTLDYGVRFLWYTPYDRSDQRVANFVPDRYDPAQAPRLFQPAVIGGKQVAYDPVSGAVQPVAYVGTFVPNTGNLAN